jgi:hypothetical protein
MSFVKMYADMESMLMADNKHPDQHIKGRFWEAYHNLRMVLTSNITTWVYFSETFSKDKFNITYGDMINNIQKFIDGCQV